MRPSHAWPADGWLDAAAKSAFAGDWKEACVSVPLHNAWADVFKEACPSCCRTWDHGAAAQAAILQEIDRADFDG